MLKKYITASVAILLGLIIGTAHSSVTSATELSAGLSHSQSKNSAPCQPTCHSDLNQQYARPTALKKKDREPQPYPNQLNSVAIEFLTNDLVGENPLWKSTNWNPPDIILLSGHYSTSL